MATSKKRGKTAPPRYDIPYVHSAANSAGWPSIFSALAGVNADAFDGRHQPCPKCGGTDRFRYLEEKQTGASICNNCNRNDCGDGLATLSWLTGWKFAECLARVADHLGILPLADSAASSSSSSKSNKESKADPAANLSWQPWNEFLAQMFCDSKPPITTAGLLACGAKMARYRGQYTVIALPVWDERAIRQGVVDGAIVGWSLWNVSGGTLPGPDGQWLKVKLTAGTQSGLIGDPSRIRSARLLLKVEGPSDLAAVHSLADLPSDVAPVTNANGAGELPKPWMVEAIAGGEANRRECLICHDADKPGQRGAVGWKDERGRHHDGWLQRLAAGGCASVGNLILPYEVAESHGRDLRDFLADGGSGWAGVLALPRQGAADGGSPPGVGTSGVVASGGNGDGSQPLEADDDPHRLARVNIARYAELAEGGRIIYWRDKWYTWKASRGCYQQISERELSARITASIKWEFDRLNLADLEKWRANPTDEDGNQKNPPEARKVSRRITSDVLNALASIVALPGSLEPNSWIEPPTPLNKPGERANLMALKNGLFDLDAFLSGVPSTSCVCDLTSNWFSFTRLPYKFEAQAKCDAWESFLEKSMEGDADRINRLQEWAGYMLTPDNRHQKFLALEGEGRNGKSVYLAGITAMLGVDNVSNIKLEDLAERFQVRETIGKLANICADANEIDVRSEGFLKSYTAGDRIHTDIKNKDGMAFVPTARLMLAWNNRPRFSDKTDGTWRRLLLVTWKYQVKEDEIIHGMDSVEHWENAGELPGIFAWALRGLLRLRENEKFTKSKKCDEMLEEFRREANPARSFLDEHTEADPPGKESLSRVPCKTLYRIYCEWCRQQGNRFPLGAEFFGKEVLRFWGEKVFKIRPRIGAGREYYYEGIFISSQEFTEEKKQNDYLSGF
jgi:P4 family phage/plasmid primase-like protien